MSFEVPSNGKSKTEEKNQQPGFVVQVSGSSNANTGVLNKLNQEHHHRQQHVSGAPIEITSKLNGDTSGDGLVSFDNNLNNINGSSGEQRGVGGNNNQGVMTVATIKPTSKQISETTVLQLNNI